MDGNDDGSTVGAVSSCICESITAAATLGRMLLLGAFGEGVVLRSINCSARF